jgi:hypothetical protein
MPSIAEALEKFNHLTDALREELARFLYPFAAVLPDARHRQALQRLAPALLASRKPHLSVAGARGVEGSTSAWALSKRFATLLHTPRFSHHAWLNVLYAQAVEQVAALPGNRRLLVAVDPLNLEKAYARKIEGICQVHKSTPPGSPPKPSRRRKEEGRITWGYPSIFAVGLNTARPALLHHRLFSYATDDFVSQPWEWMQTMRQLRQRLPGRRLCLVADAEADDQKLWLEAQAHGLELVARATKVRNVEVWEPRRHRWCAQELQEWARSHPGPAHFVKAFTHAGRTVPVRVHLNWAPFRLPEDHFEAWIVTAQTEVIGRQRPPDLWLPPPHLVLVVVGRPVRSARQAWQVYRDWAQRGQIELFYRFLQEDGLDVEKILLHKLERFRRLLLLMVMLAFFIFHLERWWSPVLIQWLRSLESSTAGKSMDRRGHYLLLRGVQRALDARALLEWIQIRPPPTRYLPHDF